MGDTYVQTGAAGPDVTAVVALVVSAMAFAASWYWSRRAEKRSYLDQFWFREVMAPGCFTAVMTFRDTTIAHLNTYVGQKVDGSLLKSVVNQAQSGVASIIDAMWVARIFRGKFYADGSEAIQKIEDVLASSLGSLLGAEAVLTKDVAATIGDKVTDICLQVLQLGVSLHSTRLRTARIRSP
jgi:hypothetical protein